MGRIVVERPRLRKFLGKPGRRLLYGRRKTGKTFYTRHVLRDYSYFIVRRGGSVYEPVEGGEYDAKSFVRLCKALDRVIVDEFHRAPGIFFDALQANECTGDLVLITSTMHYYRRLVEGREAPLQGLFNTRQVGLVSPLDLLVVEWGSSDPRSLGILLVFYQEPSLIGLGLEDIVYTGRELAPSLVGEVLDEEDYTRTRRYDAVLEAIAAGKTRPGEIADYLYARGLLDKPSPSLITKYLDIMTRTGLLERIEVWGKKRGSVYRHLSPLTSLAYYLDARYGFFDLPLEWGFAQRALEQVAPLYVEVFIERFFAQLYGLKPVKILDPEIDIALVEYNRLKIVAEVKWSKRISAREARRVEAKLYQFDAEKHLLVVPSAENVEGETGLEIVDFKRLREWALSPPSKPT